ncbi:hypothetical protein BKK52_10430 [Rodentibacter trehalosifermentans]|uniref:Uncharacterized protein n=1 Tax=Rodentibacter trehalosifermentans TaxID=1908263 RepID=A0A1V3IXP8_9PAST|nr:DUF2786 domain-containing protein [Rodentibacter trehalosifermentans]OOF46918.1 hypothetical protein BKK52_10430 [Rodentibacter trehalosifermentans]
MKSNKDKLLRKIKKLLALSKSTNPHEAASALAMAQKLMAENRINQAQVEFSQAHTKQKTAIKSARYVHMLIAIVKKAFGVDAYLCNQYPGEDWCENKMHIVFFGIDERPEVASYCFDVLYRKLQTARKAFLDTQSKRLKRSTLISRGDRFCEGWVVGVNQNVKQFAMTPEEKQKVDHYKTSIFENEKWSELKVRSAGDTRDYGASQSAGYRQGQQVTLNHGVNGKETVKLGVKQ